MEEDDWRDVRAALRRFGLPANPEQRPAIQQALEAQLHLEAEEEGDQDLMRLLCVQLFSIGQVEDALLIWRAKSCNFDAMCGLDVHFLCGAGLAETQEFLRGDGTPDALEALDYLEKSAASGDFADFTTEQVVEQAKQYFEVA